MGLPLVLIHFRLGFSMKSSTNSSSVGISWHGGLQMRQFYMAPGLAATLEGSIQRIYIYNSYIHIYNHIHLYIYIYIHIQSYTYICRYIYIYLWFNIYICIYIYVYIYTFVYMCTTVSSPWTEQLNQVSDSYLGNHLVQTHHIPHNPSYPPSHHYCWLFIISPQ